jgi:hypothetical protein
MNALNIRFTNYGAYEQLEWWVVSKLHAWVNKIYS